MDREDGEPSASTSALASEDYLEDGFSNDPKDIAHRRKLRSKFRDLHVELLENRQEYVQETGKLMQKMEAQNVLYAHVRHPREALADSNLLHCIATVGKERVCNIPVNLIQFRPGLYAEKLVTLMRGDRFAMSVSDEALIRDEWVTLGQRCVKYFKRVPSFHYMLGSFERGEVAQKRRVPKTKPDKEEPAKTVAPKELSMTNKKDAEEGTTEEIERVLGILHNLYERVDENGTSKEPICFFEFVINPHSFSLTIENIFHVSFLVRDNAASIYLDSDGLPVIVPLAKTKQTGSAPKKTNQMVIDMSIDKWKEIVEVFEIQEPLIPPRS